MKGKGLFNCADVRGVKSVDMRAATVDTITHKTQSMNGIRYDETGRGL